MEEKSPVSVQSFYALCFKCKKECAKKELYLNEGMHRKCRGK